MFSDYSENPHKKPHKEFHNSSFLNQYIIYSPLIEFSLCICFWSLTVTGLVRTSFIYSAILSGPLALIRAVRCRIKNSLRSSGSCVHKSRLISCCLPARHKLYKFNKVFFFNLINKCCIILFIWVMKYIFCGFF